MIDWRDFGKPSVLCYLFLLLTCHDPATRVIVGGAPISKRAIALDAETIVGQRHFSQDYPTESYGMVPRTLAEDGDPLDVIVLGRGIERSPSRRSSRTGSRACTSWPSSTSDIRRAARSRRLNCADAMPTSIQHASGDSLIGGRFHSARCAASSGRAVLRACARDATADAIRARPCSGLAGYRRHRLCDGSIDRRAAASRRSH